MRYASLEQCEALLQLPVNKDDKAAYVNSLEECRSLLLTQAQYPPNPCLHCHLRITLNEATQRKPDTILRLVQVRWGADSMKLGELPKY